MILPSNLLFWWLIRHKTTIIADEIRTGVTQLNIVIAQGSFEVLFMVTLDSFVDFPNPEVATGDK